VPSKCNYQVSYVVRRSNYAAKHTRDVKSCKSPLHVFATSPHTVIHGVCMTLSSPKEWVTSVSRPRGRKFTACLLASTSCKLCAKVYAKQKFAVNGNQTLPSELDNSIITSSGKWERGCTSYAIRTIARQATMHIGKRFFCWSNRGRNHGEHVAPKQDRTHPGERYFRHPARSLCGGTSQGGSSEVLWTVLDSLTSDRSSIKLGFAARTARHAPLLPHVLPSSRSLYIVPRFLIPIMFSYEFLANHKNMLLSQHQWRRVTEPP